MEPETSEREEDVPIKKKTRKHRKPEWYDGLKALLGADGQRTPSEGELVAVCEAHGAATELWKAGTVKDAKSFLKSYKQTAAYRKLVPEVHDEEANTERAPATEQRAQPPPHAAPPPPPRRAQPPPQVHGGAGAPGGHAAPPGVAALAPSQPFASPPPHNPRKRPRDTPAPEEVQWADEPPPWLLCELCRNVFRGEVLGANECGHEFCKPCITGAFALAKACPKPGCGAEYSYGGPPASWVSPRPKLMQQRAQLKAWCRFSRKRADGGAHRSHAEGMDEAAGMWVVDPEGCPSAAMRFDELETHEASCGYALMPCPNAHPVEGACGVMVRRSALEAHMAVCPLTSSACPACGLAFMAADKEAHAKECSEARVCCPYAGCGAWLRRADVGSHNATCWQSHLSGEKAAREAIAALADSSDRWKHVRDSVASLLQDSDNLLALDYLANQAVLPAALALMAELGCFNAVLEALMCHSTRADIQASGLPLLGRLLARLDLQAADTAPLLGRAAAAAAAAAGAGCWPSVSAAEQRQPKYEVDPVRAAAELLGALAACASDSDDLCGVARHAAKTAVRDACGTPHFAYSAALLALKARPEDPRTAAGVCRCWARLLPIETTTWVKGLPAQQYADGALRALRQHPTSADVALQAVVALQYVGVAESNGGGTVHVLLNSLNRWPGEPAIQAAALEALINVRKSKGATAAFSGGEGAKVVAATARRSPQHTKVQLYAALCAVQYGGVSVSTATAWVRAGIIPTLLSAMQERPNELPYQQAAAYAIAALAWPCQDSRGPLQSGEGEGPATPSEQGPSLPCCQALLAVCGAAEVLTALLNRLVIGDAPATCTAGLRAVRAMCRSLPSARRALRLARVLDVLMAILETALSEPTMPDDPEFGAQAAWVLWSLGELAEVSDYAMVLLAAGDQSGEAGVASGTDAQEEALLMRAELDKLGCVQAVGRALERFRGCMQVELPAREALKALTSAPA